MPDAKPKEKTILLIRPSWRAYAEFIAAGVFLLIFAGLGAFILLWVAYELRARRYAVTNLRVNARRGLWRQKTENIALLKIRGAQAYQGTLGRYLDVGDVLIFAGPDKKPAMEIKGVDSPKDLANEIKAVAKKAAAKAAKAAPAQNQP